VKPSGGTSPVPMTSAETPVAMTPAETPRPIIRATMRVLMIGGETAEAEAVQQALSASTSISFEFTHVLRLPQAVEMLDSLRIDAVLLVVSVSRDGTGESDELDQLARLRIRAPNVPVLVLSNADDETLAAQALQMGARGFLLLSEANTRLLTTTLCAARGTHRTILELNQAREQARHTATHDLLTGLANRQLFNDRLRQAVEAARRSRQQVGVVFLDLDNFKTVNDTLGHAVGDGLLRAVGGHLQEALRGIDTAARFGGDEFALLLTNLAGPQEAADVARRVLDTLGRPMRLKSHSMVITASLGIATFPRDGADPEELVEKADTAMYHAKERGRNRYKFFTPEMRTSVMRRAAMLSRLRSASEDGSLVLHYQPQFDLRRGCVVGAEALVRWKHPKLGLLSPDKFLPLAEETGFIVQIGEWVLREACRQNASWQQMGYAGFRIAVNVSPHQFQEPDFSDVVRSALRESGLRPELLELEITESSLVRDAELTISTMHTLKKQGVHLSIDDFGTGYSALSYLKHLPIDVLKIDQSFVSGVTTDPADATIIESILHMAQGLNLSTVAEGVETREQMLLLGSYGCKRLQGFLFGAPCPPEELTRQLEKPDFQWAKEEDEDAGAFIA
jgi:diguanylate cyclase (GGDEF)-like protein